MIRLSNISADYVLYGSEQRFLDLARENNCYSVEDLISLTKLYPKYNWDVVNKRIDELKLIVERNNIKGIELETYEYENNGIELVDKLNRGDVLLLDNPTLELQTKFRGLRTYSIDEIKHNLKLTDQFGRNVIGRIRNIGPDSITKIISALKMYDEQILRQANLTEKKNYNLFLKDCREIFRTGDIMEAFKNRFGMTQDDVKKYFYTHALLSYNYILLTVGSTIAHKYKNLAVYSKPIGELTVDDFTKNTEQSYVTSTKRMVALSATGHAYQRGILTGLPNTANYATISDYNSPVADLNKSAGQEMNVWDGAVFAPITTL